MWMGMGMWIPRRSGRSAHGEVDDSSAMRPDVEKIKNWRSKSTLNGLKGHAVSSNYMRVYFTVARGAYDRMA